MQYKKWKKAVVLALSAALLLPTNVSADLKTDIYVGDVVSISSKDLLVQSNYKSMDEITKEYTQDTGNVTSNNTSIDSSDGKLQTGSGNSIIDGLITDKDLSSELPDKQKKTLSYDDFMKLIGDQNDEIKKKYEDAKKNAQDAQKKRLLKNSGKL